MDVLKWIGISACGGFAFGLAVAGVIAWRASRRELLGRPEAGKRRAKP